MFSIECFIYLVIFLYSLIYQIRVIIKYKKNSKIEIKDATGLYISKDILNENNLSTLYVTKIMGKHNDHYDIERNVIRLSEDVYEKNNLSSMAIAFYQSILAIYYNKRHKNREDKIKNMIIDWCNKIAFVLFIIGASSKALDMMTLSLIFMIVIIVLKYNYMTDKIDLLNKNISYLKKEYKLTKKEFEELENNMKLLLYNELSLHLFNNKY